MTVRNASPGVLLLRDGTAVLKTEYAKNDSGDPEVYLLASGEYYCGGYDEDCVDATDDVIDAARSRWESPDTGGVEQ